MKGHEDDSYKHTFFWDPANYSQRSHRLNWTWINIKDEAPPGFFNTFFDLQDAFEKTWTWRAKYDSVCWSGTWSEENFSFKFSKISLHQADAQNSPGRNWRSYTKLWSECQKCRNLDVLGILFIIWSNWKKQMTSAWTQYSWCFDEHVRHESPPAFEQYPQGRGLRVQIFTYLWMCWPQSFSEALNETVLHIGRIRWKLYQDGLSCDKDNV